MHLQVQFLNHAKPVLIPQLVQQLALPVLLDSIVQMLQVLHKQHARLDTTLKPKQRNFQFLYKQTNLVNAHHVLVVSIVPLQHLQNVHQAITP